jgi:hypothetical protein
VEHLARLPDEGEELMQVVSTGVALEVRESIRDFL